MHPVAAFDQSSFASQMHPRRKQAINPLLAAFIHKSRTSFDTIKIKLAAVYLKDSKLVKYCFPILVIDQSYWQTIQVSGMC